jgi:hypothetical protein
MKEKQILRMIRKLIEGYSSSGVNLFPRFISEEFNDGVEMSFDMIKKDLIKLKLIIEEKDISEALIYYDKN